MLEDPDYVGSYDILKAFYSRTELAVNRLLGDTTQSAPGAECRSDNIVPPATGGIDSPRQDSGCGYAYSYADILPAVPEYSPGMEAQWAAQKEQQVMLTAEGLKAKIIEKGGDDAAVAEVFHEAQAFYAAQMESAIPGARYAAGQYLTLLPEALRLAVKAVRDQSGPDSTVSPDPRSFDMM